MAGIFDSGIFDSGIFDVQTLDGFLAGQVPVLGAFTGSHGAVGALSGDLPVVAGEFDGNAAQSLPDRLGGRSGGRRVRRNLKYRVDLPVQPVVGNMLGIMPMPIGVFLGEAEAFNAEALNQQIIVLLAA